MTDALDLDALIEEARRFPDECVDAFEQGHWDADECVFYTPDECLACDGAKLVGRLVAEVERLTQQRDSAREWAVTLEQQNAAISELHRELRIYDPCDCGHSDEAVLAGDAVDTGEFIACEETYLYSICRECCTDSSGEQRPDCFDDHCHGTGVPFCKTQRILGAFPDDDEITEADWRGRYCTGGCGHMERSHHDGRCDGLGEDNERCDCNALRIFPDDETAVQA